MTKEKTQLAGKIREKVHSVLVFAKIAKVRSRLSGYIDLCQETYGDELLKAEPTITIPSHLEDTLVEYFTDTVSSEQDQQRSLFDQVAV